MTLLMETSFRISLVMLGALAATALLRSQSAALRHWVLSMAILCAAATPLLGLVMPAWHLPFRGSTSVASVAQPSVVTTIQIEQPAGASIGGEPARTHATSDWVARGHWLAGLWIAGVAINLSVLLAGLFHLRSVTSRAQRVAQGKWVDVADDVARAHGLHRRVRLFRTEHPTLLVTWGLWRPRVMMPVAADEWPEDRLRVVLSHELAHIRRGDWVLQIAAELVRSAYWFNPLLWIACARRASAPATMWCWAWASKARNTPRTWWTWREHSNIAGRGSLDLRAFRPRASQNRRVSKGESPPC